MNRTTKLLLNYWVFLKMLDNILKRTVISSNAIDAKRLCIVYQGCYLNQFPELEPSNNIYKY